MAKKLMKGCEAVAEAAIQAGCHYFFGYPITPQNDIPEYMARRLPQVGGCLNELRVLNHKVILQAISLIVIGCL